MKQIGFSLTQYGGDYDSRLPWTNTNYGTDMESHAAGLEILRTSGILTDYAIYICPSSTTSAQTGTLALDKKTVDYGYRMGMMLGDSAKFGRSDSGVCADIALGGATDAARNGNSPNHTDYGNILFLGGNVNGFSTSRWYTRANRGNTLIIPPMTDLNP